MARLIFLAVMLHRNSPTFAEALCYSASYSMMTVNICFTSKWILAHISALSDYRLANGPWPEFPLPDEPTPLIARVNGTDTVKDTQMR
jgi:hypothetical protein